jgi:hypothetical protein
VLASSALAQSSFQNAAALFSGERKDNVFATMSNAQVVKEFSPMLKDSQDSAGFVLGAFALAMKGVDIDTNIGRMVIPLKHVADDKLDELIPNRGFAENQVRYEDIPDAMFLIYKTRHYTPALKALFTMPVDGPCAENRDDDVMAQLRKDPKPVLALAAADKGVYATLWDLVDWNVGSMTDRKIFIHRMQTAHWTTPAMKRVALQLAKDLKTPKNRPAK